MTPELMTQLFELALIPLAIAITKFLIDFLAAKRDEVKSKTDSDLAKKYIDMITDTITRCVIATNQTYVDSLKKQGRFDPEAQGIAFNMTYQAVMSILSEDAKKYIEESTGDMKTYLIQLIEAEVAKNKSL